MTWLKSNRNAVASLYAINVLLIITLPLAGVIEITLPGAGVAYAMFFVMNCLGITTTFHRFLSHRSFTFKAKWIERLFTMCGVISAAGSPLGWVGIHRDHHRYSDTVQDPHQGSLGFWRLQAIRYNFKTSPFLSRYGTMKGKWGIRDIVTDNFQLWAHGYYFGFLAIYVGALAAVFGLPGLFYGFIVPSALTMFSQNLTNWVAHLNLGYRSHDAGDNSSNVWWLNFLAFGDGWHNNHHAHQGSHTTREKWWEIDPTGMVIALVKA